MPDPNLQAYLAAKYLSGPRADAILARHNGDEGVKKKKKKRKREDAGPSAAAAGGSGGLVIRDDLESWKRSAEGDDEDDLLLGDAQLVEADAASRRKAKFKKAFRGAEEEEAKPDAEDERPELAGEDGLNLGIDDQARLHSARDAAAVATDGSASIPAPRQAAESPAKRARAGLMTKEEMRAERVERERLEAEKRAQENEEHERGEQAAHQQTVYRDRSGRKIDVEAEERALAEEKRRRDAKEREKKEWGKGVAQREQINKNRARLEQAKEEGVARYADDKRMNDSLRNMERIDDPALAFLTKKRERGPRKPRYQGPPPPPNRFGIQPGYRWDGVDRSNGFEKLYYEKINERSRRKIDSHAWGQEDM